GLAGGELGEVDLGRREDERRVVAVEEGEVELAAVDELLGEAGAAQTFAVLTDQCCELIRSIDRHNRSVVESERGMFGDGLDDVPTGDRSGGGRSCGAGLRTAIERESGPAGAAPFRDEVHTPVGCGESGGTEARFRAELVG